MPPSPAHYFDHNATAPLSPLARAAWLEAEGLFWANPSSPHRPGAAAALALREARETLAAYLAVEPGRICFTSGATEANNALLAAHAGAAVALSAVEHPSVYQPARRYSRAAETLPVDTGGRLQLDALAARLRAGGLDLVSVMAANNETGVLQPWVEAARLCRAAGVPFHCDATQWLGRLDPEGLAACDYLTASAHKCGGPKGVGLLLLRPGSSVPQLQFGGEQEQGRRAGTENVPAIAAAVAAWTSAPDADARRARVALRDAAAQAIVLRTGAELVGAAHERLWNTLGLILPRHDKQRWVARLDRLGFSVSTGSACSTGKEGPSPGLTALGLDASTVRRFVRCSAGSQTTAADWQALSEAFVRVSEELEASASFDAVVDV